MKKLNAPFSNGTEFMMYDEINCCECLKYGNCELRNILYDAMWIDVEWTEELYKRLGFSVPLEIGVIPECTQKEKE